MISEHRKDLALGIIVNSYDIPRELLPESSRNALGTLKAKGSCPFVDGCAGAKCINEFCRQPRKPKSNSEDDCLLLSEDEDAGRRMAVEVLYHLGLTVRDAFASFCMSA